MEKLSYFMSADRYFFDFGQCNSQNGYAQIDTSQDASYYGIWANPEKRVIVTYCEGDVTVQTARDNEEFKEEILKLKKWHEDFGYTFEGIDAGLNELLSQRFIDIGLGELLH